MTVRYCGRDFSEQELTQIRRLITDNPGCCRAELSRMTCRTLEWYKADGGLKDMSARVAMLRMQEDGLIALPPPRSKRPDPSVHLTPRSNPGPPITQPAGALKPLFLYCFVVKRRPPPDVPPSLDTMVRMVAGFGGFLNRKGDGFPGAQTIWIGLQRGRDFAQGIAMAKATATSTCG